MADLTAGELIRTHRKRKHWSQHELAVRVACTSTTIHRIEAGQNCAASTMSRIVQALELSDEDAALVLRRAGS